MKELYVTKPIFYSNFTCIGSDCIEHCCRGWSVSIDKDTYNKYKNSDVFIIKDVVENHMILKKKNKFDFATIKLNDETGDCPLLDSDKLCNVYKHMGPSALSHTCTTYPRLAIDYKEEKLLSLSLSCPEATRLVLFDKESMLQEQSTEIIPKYADIPPFNPSHKLVNLFCANLIMAPSAHIENNLYAIAKFLIFLQKINNDINTNLEQVENVFLDLVEELQNENYSPKAELKQNASSKIKITLMILFQTITNDHTNKRGRPYITANNSLILSFFDNLSAEMDKEYLDYKFNEINDLWDNILENGILSDANILKNYFLYRIYNESFPGKELSQSLRFFYYLLADYFYLKTSLSLISKNKELTQEDIIKMFYSYHTLKQHNKEINKNLDSIVSKINLGDDISSIMLLS